MSGSWLIAFLFFIGGLLIMGLAVKRFILRNDTNKDNDKYWAREHAATFIRKKEVPKECFIEVDFSIYPKLNDEDCQTVYEKILLFKERPLVNFKDMSNVELKERFGAMQLDKLSSYERNLIEYMNTSLTYGKLLYKKGYLSEAQQVLEYIISLGCDLSQCYSTLANIYAASYAHSQKASLLSSSSADLIIDLLTILKEKACTNMAASPYLQKVIQGIDLHINHLHESEML